VTLLFPIDEPDLVRFLQSLVRVPTVNPPGNEVLLAPLIADRLRLLGCDVQIVESESGRANIVAALQGSGGGPTLIWNGHMDVQPPGNDWTYDPFGAHIEGDRLYGRGAVDMKAGIAAVLAAASALRAADVVLRGDLIFAIVADEVSGGREGTGFLTERRLLHGDMAIVGEPTGDQVNIAHRGTLWAEIEIRGKSAHGGRPWLGVNAISKMIRVANAIEIELVPHLQRRTHAMLPAPSVNFGTIQGGVKFNLVADRCTLQIDRRLIPGETAARALAELGEVCARVNAQDPEPFVYSVREVMQVKPMEIAADAEIVRACQRAYREVTGQEAALGCTAGFEDAHYLMEAGIPTAMFGPYRRAEASRPAFFTTSGMADEYVELPATVLAARVYARLIHNLLR
jgi:succinyl-diaminopimelate desuccinylase